MTTTRRAFFGILGGAIAAPIVVRSGLLMPVKALQIIVPKRPVLALGGLIKLSSPEGNYSEHFRVASFAMTRHGTIEVEAVEHTSPVTETIPQIRPPLLMVNYWDPPLIDITSIADDKRRFIQGIREPARARFEIMPETVDLAMEAA